MSTHAHDSWWKGRLCGFSSCAVFTPCGRFNHNLIFGSHAARCYCCSYEVPNLMDLLTSTSTAMSEPVQSARPSLLVRLALPFHPPHHKCGPEGTWLRGGSHYTNPQCSVGAVSGHANQFLPRQWYPIFGCDIYRDHTKWWWQVWVQFIF